MIKSKVFDAATSAAQGIGDVSARLSGEPAAGPGGEPAAGLGGEPAAGPGGEPAAGPSGEPSARLSRARRSLDGLSVGDSFGERFFGPAFLVARWLSGRSLPDGPWRYTDDTEMALGICEVLEALDAHGRLDQDHLARVFSRRYRQAPHRGYGGTACEILDDIGAGMPWRQVAGQVFGGRGSMGNGGAMRVAPLGAYFADDLDRVISEARASAEVTHAHPEGQAGAIAVAVAAAGAVRLTGREPASAAPPDRDLGRRILELAIAHTPHGATHTGLLRAQALPEGCSVPEAVRVLGNGSQIISQDTVPFALWCVAQDPRDYEAALWRTVSALGDRDTTCAIVGGIVALSGSGPPPHWLAQREPLALR